jgi:RNA polymerase sigma factor (sigma-70 family)
MADPRSLLRFVRRLAVRGDASTDRQLLARFVAARDEAAFAALVGRHGPMVLGVCRRVLGDAHDAEDAFQAAFLVLARKAASIGRPDALGNWLYGVAYRTALGARARASRRRARERELAEEPAVDTPRDVAWGELRAALDAEVARLPHRYRSAFVLCCLEGRTNEETARLLGCPKGTVHSRLSWARQRLRDRLTRRGVALPAAGAAALWSVDALSAAVPAALAGSTARAAALFASGQAAASAEVLSLAKGVLQAMFLQKVKVLSAALLAVGVVCGGVVWLGQRAGASDPPEPEMPAARADAGGLRDTLLALEKRSWEATKKKDVKELRKLCAEDYEAVLSDGSRLTRDEFFDLFPLFEVKSYALSDVRARPLGPDAALITYKVKSKTVIAGVALDEETQISSTWVRRDGEWRNVFYQETSIE